MSRWVDYPAVSMADSGVDGWWSVTVEPVGSQPLDITVVRGIATEISSIGFTDPFGPSTAQLVFPSLTMLDSIGEGDLHWWKPGNRVTVLWRANQISKTSLVRDEVRWEGYIAGEQSSMADSGGRLSMTLKGALRAMDNRILMPLHLQRPLTFEGAIALAVRRSRSRLRPSFEQVRMQWPEWWSLRYTADIAAQKPWLVPLGFMDDDPEPRWTGMVTRETGQFEQALTSYVQGLLGSMFTDRGQFTLMLDPGRVPVLKHRDRFISSATFEIDIATPGVACELACDYETKVSVVYGRGRALDGTAFSNMNIDSSGSSYYEPFAYHFTAYPDREGNAYAARGSLRRDVALTFYEGMSPEEAASAAGKFARRNAVAGYTGSITLTSDPYVETPDGLRLTMPRHTIMAGDTVRLRHFQGRDPGAVFHITEASTDVMSGTTTLTVDTVFRDFLTSEEVRLRGRDALTTTMSLTTGKYQPSIRDQLLPWQHDSGFIPYTGIEVLKPARSPEQSPDDPIGTEGEPFPWTATIAQRPPSDPFWRKSYIHIPPAQTWPAANAQGANVSTFDGNWSRRNSSEAKHLVKLSQAGSIRLLQIVAVDADGAQMNVPFHVSFYYNHAVAARDMPRYDAAIPPFEHPLFPGAKTGFYPFFPGAWEEYNVDGTKPLPGDRQNRFPAEGSGFIQQASFGTYYVPAGYYPGDPRNDGAVPTGMLSIESPFAYDVEQFQSTMFNPALPYNPDATSPSEGNSFYDTQGNPAAGFVSVMIYCDSMWDEDQEKLVVRNKDVYFIGRAFRAAPGNG